MHFRIRDLDPDGQFVPQLRLDLLAQVFPRTEIQAVFAELGLYTQRVRKLSLEGLLWLLIGMNLLPQAALPDVWEQLTHGLRLLWPEDAERQAFLPGKGAISYRRKQLGVRPLRRLFQRVCRPLATRQTRGAWLGDKRLVAIDAHTEDVPDTPANALAFGRPTTDRGASAYPQVRCVSLGECGTHAIFDTDFWPYRIGEDRGAYRLLRSVTPEMLVLVDAGLHSYDLLVGVRDRGAAALFRLPATVQPQRLRRLPDGSALVRLLPSDPQRRRRGEHAEVRLIEYRNTDPQSAAYGRHYRLVTTLLDPLAFPAHRRACAYHERWELELTIDEIDTHQLRQHLPASPLRSRTPAGVIQELYGLFLAHFAVRSLMHAAALQGEEDPERLSFTHALQVIQASLADFEIAAPELHPGLYRRLLQDLIRPLLPERAPRVEPRVVKRKVIKWPLKRYEHYQSRPPTRPFWAAIEIFNSHEAALI